MVIEPYKYDIGMLFPCYIYDIPHGIAYWRNRFPFHTSHNQNCGAYHNRHKPYWN